MYQIQPHCKEVPFSSLRHAWIWPNVSWQWFFCFCKLLQSLQMFAFNLLPLFQTLLYKWRFIFFFKRILYGKNSGAEETAWVCCVLDCLCSLVLSALSRMGELSWSCLGTLGLKPGTFGVEGMYSAMKLQICAPNRLLCQLLLKARLQPHLHALD